MYLYIVGETSHPKRRRRKTSEGSSTGRGEQLQSAMKESTATTKTTSAQPTKDNDLSSKTESTRNVPNTVEEVNTATCIDSSAQGSMSVPSSVTQTESGGLSEGASASEKPVEKEAHGVLQHSSAGQMQSSADSQPSTTVGVVLNVSRGNSVAAGSGKTVPKFKKKIAPKVISSRPRRTPHSSAPGTGKQAFIKISLLNFCTMFMPMKYTIFCMQEN